MKNILFFFGAFGGEFGGIEGKILLIAKNLAEKQIFFPILATSDRNSIFSRYFREMGFLVYEVPMRGKGGIKKGINAVDNLLKKHNVAVIQSHMFRESIISGKIRNKHNNLRHVFRVHTHISGSNIPIWKRCAYHILEHQNAKNVDIYVPIGNIIKKELIKKSRISSKKIRIVYNGIAALGLPDPPNNGSSPLTPSVVMLGDLQERKQQCMAAKTIGILHSKKIDVNLHLIGGERDGYSAEVKQTAMKNNVSHLVHFYGYKNQKEIYEIIRDIPVVILPSLFEGIPTSILEGMSLRKLVIATPVGGTTELVKDGINGIIQPAQSPETWANILERVFTKPAYIWEPMRNAGYRIWKEKYSMEQMMDGLINVYKKLNLLDK